LPPASADTPLRFDRFELHPAERVLRVRGKPVTLGSRAFDLLLVLAQRHERLVTKQELLDLVWPGLVVEEHNIATQISTLRKLLGATAITTLPGYGYRLTAVRSSVPDLPAASPVPSAPPPLRHNLPEPRTRFIGREAALADLARLLPSTRLLTLTGIGGCGKTRLALQFAQQQRAAFADGVWFVDLAPLKDAQRVVSTCAAVLGLREEGDRPLMQRVLEHLAARRTLLLLDNCEHVIDGVAAVVDALLSAAAGSAAGACTASTGTTGTVILATSREGLGVAGEQIYPVRSLSLPATAELSAVQSAEAVRVFVDRARLACPDFEVGADNAAAIVEICRRLDGIALAIELAAARVPMLPVAEIAARLDDRFRLLTGGSRALPRHQTLYAAMQWSYEQLSPPEQRMLCRLSVFAGGWTLQAAAEVAPTADEYEALALLTVLHDKSLLAVDRTDAGGLPRYWMLETVRQYAMERLHERGEGEDARGRHAAYYVAWTEAAEPHVRGPDQDAWISRFRQEQENLIAALNWCSEGPVNAQSGLRLAAATNFYWIWNGVEQGYRLTRAALEHDVAAADTPARVGALCAAAHLSLFRGRYDESLDHALAALAAARRIGTPQTLTQALDQAGSALNTQGRIDEALQCHEEALALTRRLGDARRLSRLLNGLAESRRSAGQLDQAEQHYREALAVAREQSDRLGVVVTLNNLIRVQVAKGRPELGRHLARECLPLVRGQKVGVDLLEASVGLAACLAEHEWAARFWGAADQTLKAWGYRHQPVDVEHTAPLIARSRHSLGDAAFEAAEATGRARDFDAAMLELEQWLDGAA
jgi:predicted ATPase/DNA-binding winged helix-turn-helix (wHTH) protein